MEFRTRNFEAYEAAKIATAMRLQSPSVRNPVHCGHRLRSKADTAMVIADSRWWHLRKAGWQG